MSDDDLIRRGDALAAIPKVWWHYGDTKNAQQCIRAVPAADARAEALLKRAAQMAYEVWDDPEALAKAILALIPEKQP